MEYPLLSFAVGMNDVCMDISILSLAIKNQNIFAGTNQNGVFFSDNNGVNWVKLINGFPEYPTVTSLSFIGESLFAGTSYGEGIFKSYDNGNNWFSCGLFADIRDIENIDNNIFLGTNIGVFLSSDDGNTWASVNEGFINTNVLSLTFNDKYLFAGTEGGGIWERPLSELLELDETIMTHNLKLFPNPAFDQVTIVNNWNTTKELKVTINDITGKQVLYTFFTNQKQITLDISNLDPGVYVLTLSTQNESICEKLIIQ